MIERREDGFSLIELVIAMTVFTFVIAASTGMFIPLMNQFTQQSKVAETHTEGIIGLELLRVDIEHAGFGLPWNVRNTIDFTTATPLDTDADGNVWEDLPNYGEAVSGGPADPTAYNDATLDLDGDANPGEAPRAILSDDGVVNGSDYLVIKSTLAAGSNASQRWSYVIQGNPPNIWGDEDLIGSDNVIVIKPKEGEDRLRALVADANGNFSTTFGAIVPASLFFSPQKLNESFIIYGINSNNPNNPLRMPFNRADYFISVANVPTRCAPGTGVLEKGVINNSTGATGGTITTFLPLLDCVADFQVAFGLDITATPDGTIDCYENDLANGLAPVDAANIRDRVREVRIYMLAQEGQFDRYYNFTTAVPNTIRVGEGNPRDCGGVPILGQDFDLNAAAITNWANYRWKVYTLVIKPENLR